MPTRAELNKTRAITHGLTVGGKWHPAYQSWKNMRSRCENPKSTHYNNYGGRGIKVCPEWGDFSVFWADMGEIWEEGLTIDRKDNDKDYCRENCQWSTRLTQNRNKRNVVYIDTPMGRLCAADVEKVYGIKSRTLRKRLNRGWKLEDILTPAVIGRNQTWK